MPVALQKDPRLTSRIPWAGGGVRSDGSALAREEALRAGPGMSAGTSLGAERERASGRLAAWGHSGQAVEAVRGWRRGLRAGYRSGEWRSRRGRTWEMRGLRTLGTIYGSGLFLCLGLALLHNSLPLSTAVGTVIGPQGIYK